MNRTMEEDLDSVLQMSFLGQPYGYGLKREDIIGWYYRWAGRPTREQIIEALKIGGGIIKGVNENSDIRAMSHGGWNIEQLVDSLLALYAAPPVQKRLSRGTIEAVLFKHSDARFGASNPRIISLPITQLVDDLCALIGGEEPSQPEWCLHTYRNDSRWWMATTELINGKRVLDVSSFKFCPICSAKRPAD